LYERHIGSLSENSGRVRRGDVKLGEMIAQMPEHYVDGVASVFASHRRRHLCESARRYGRSLLFQEMRAMLREAQRVEFRLGDELLWLAAGLAALPAGRWCASRLLSAWREFLKPALHWARRSG
jgi:hypothetical protein